MPITDNKEITKLLECCVALENEKNNLQSLIQELEKWK